MKLLTNGEFIALYYNPVCENDDNKSGSYVQKFLCANFIYDLNGSKGPNQTGIDIGFVTAFYKNDLITAAPVIYPMNPNSSYINSTNSSSACKNLDDDLRWLDI